MYYDKVLKRYKIFHNTHTIWKSWNLPMCSMKTLLGDFNIDVSKADKAQNDFINILYPWSLH